MIKIKISRLRERRLGSGADLGPQPSTQGWHAPCKTDHWVASPKVITLFYLRNLFTDCYPFTAGSTEALELSEAPVSRISQSAIRCVSLTVIARARAASYPRSRLHYAVLLV